MSPIQTVLRACSHLITVVAVGCFATAAFAQTYPLVCKAGSNMILSVGFVSDRNFAVVTFKPSNAPSSAGVQPGYCAWSDRGWRTGEPTNLYFPDVGRVVATFTNGAYRNVSFTRNDVRDLEEITRNTGRTFVFQVRREGNSMTVHRVGP
jgi:hypothetical protein